MTDKFQGWPELNTPEDADATQRWANACLEMWEVERAELKAENVRLRARLALLERRSHPMDYDSPAFD